MEKFISLRMDDVGASSKLYEQYSKKLYGLANISFLKRLPYFKAWGPYPELTAIDWSNIANILETYNAKLTVGITASWVNKFGDLVPYHIMFPESYNALYSLVDRKLVKIACHGLTHCVLDRESFLPRFFASNRSSHREFWDWLPCSVHYEHLSKSKHLLESLFDCSVDLLIPPGNVFSDKTIEAATKLGFTAINCNTSYVSHKIKILGNHNICAFHDREIQLYGVVWLKNLIHSYSSRGYGFKFID